MSTRGWRGSRARTSRAAPAVTSGARRCARTPDDEPARRGRLAAAHSTDAHTTASSNATRRSKGSSRRLVVCRVGAWRVSVAWLRRGSRRATSGRASADRRSVRADKTRQTILHGPETLRVRPPATTMAKAQRERPWSGRGGCDGAVAVSLLPCSPARRARRGVPHLSVFSAVAARPSRGMWWWQASAPRLRRSTSPPVVVVVDAPQRPSENRAADWCWCGCAKGERLMCHFPCMK